MNQTIPTTDAAQPSFVPVASSSTSWGVGAHLAAFVGVWVAGLALVGPLTVWLVKRDDAFVAEHAREALNFNITVALAGVVGAIVATIAAVITLGLALVVVIPVAIVAAIGWVILTIQGAMAASRGERFSYPFSYPFVR